MDLVDRYRWSSRIRANDSWEAQAYVGGAQQTATLHRLISGASDGQQVAFIDGDPQNCRLNNLRTYDSLGERLRDFHTCQVPLLRRQSNVKSYAAVGGLHWQGFFRTNGRAFAKAGFESMKAAQEWVLSEKAAQCDCGDQA